MIMFKLNPSTLNISELPTPKADRRIHLLLSPYPNPKETELSFSCQISRDVFIIDVFFSLPELGGRLVASSFFMLSLEINE